MQEDEKSLKNVIAGGEDKSAIAVTQIKDLDSCSMGSISHAEAWMLPQQFRIIAPAGAKEISPRRILRILWSK